MRREAGWRQKVVTAADDTMTYRLPVGAVTDPLAIAIQEVVEFSLQTHQTTCSGSSGNAAGTLAVVSVPKTQAKR